MASYLKSVIKKISYRQRNKYLNTLKLDDTYALSLLQPLLIGYDIIPFTGASLRPFCLIHILNDILINDRRTIIEFGSGISTVIIGRLIKKNKLTATLLSIEHDEKWAQRLDSLLKNEDLNDSVKVIYAPLTDCHLAIDNNKWYDMEALTKQTENKKFDLVIIDGPPAWEAINVKARYPALPFMTNKLAPLFSIYLDDVNRLGEQSILNLWEQKYSYKFRITGSSLAYYRQGASKLTEPFIYY